MRARRSRHCYVVSEAFSITLPYGCHHKFEIAYRASTSLASTVARACPLSFDFVFVWVREGPQLRDAVGDCGSCNQPGESIRHAVTSLAATFFVFVLDSSWGAPSGRSSSGSPAGRGHPRLSVQSRSHRDISE